MEFDRNRRPTGRLNLQKTTDVYIVILARLNFPEFLVERCFFLGGGGNCIC